VVSAVARLSVGLVLAISSSALLAVGQPVLGSRTRVLDWNACFCDAGGDQSNLFITIFITWFQAMSVVGGAMIGRLVVRQSSRQSWAATAALSVSATMGALAGIPAAVREAAAVTRPFGYAPPSATSVREAAITGVVLGTLAAFGAAWSARASVGAALSWAWLWLVGLASTRNNGGYTAALGMLYGYSGSSAATRVADIVPLAIMSAIVAGTAWWGTRRGRPRYAGMYAAMLGPALVLAAYLSEGFPTENMGGLENAFALILLATMAAAGAAAAGAWRGPYRHRRLDPLIIVLAVAGILSAALTGIAPVVYGPAPFANPLTKTLFLAALVALPFLPAAADSVTGIPRGEQRSPLMAMGSQLESD
jgi:hypothetical protein